MVSASATFRADILIRRDHGFWVTKRIGTIEAFTYWAAQLVGATAALFVEGRDPEETWRAVALGAPELARDFPVWAGIALEGVTTFFLVFTVFATAVDEKARFAPSPALVSACRLRLHSRCRAADGRGFKSARAFGPALAATHWAHQGVYWVGPWPEDLSPACSMILSI